MFTKKDTPIEPCSTDDGNIFKHKTVPTAVDDCCDSVCKPIIGETTVIYGLDGETGATGEAGVGVPVSGTTGQILAKASGVDYDTEWINSPESGLTEDVAVSNDGLGLTLPYTFLEGTSFTSAWKALTQKTFYPTFTNPTFSLSNNAGLREIAESASFTLTFNYTRGNILGNIVSGAWSPSTFQNFRGGAASTYNYIYTANNITQAGNTLGVSGYTVLQGNNTFNGTVTQLIGTQPLDSLGANYLSPYPAGTSPTQSTSFEGVYPLFATTVGITTATKQGLVSMTSANNVQVDLVAETGGNKQFFEIPDAWLTLRFLSYVNYFNTVSNQFDVSNKLTDFTATSVNKTIQGNTVGYKKYTYNGSDRANILIRLGF